MAHSIQVVDGRAEAFNDLDLIALVGLMAQEMKRGTPGHEMLEPLMADWRARLAFYGPGTIDLKLDGVISSSALREQVVSLLAAVESRVRAFGDAVPAPVLNELRMVPGVRFHDHATSTLVSAIIRLRALLVSSPAS
jgi:hypothetical protein